MPFSPLAAYGASKATLIGLTGDGARDAGMRRSRLSRGRVKLLRVSVQRVVDQSLVVALAAGDRSLAARTYP